MDDKTRMAILDIMCELAESNSMTVSTGAYLDRIAALWPKPQGKINAIQIPLHCLNKLQMDSIREMLKKAQHMHYADIIMTVDGQDIRFQADWIKSMVMPQDKED